MFSLIITIISIALVAALALATIYYGGSAFNKGSADAKASQFINEGQQLTGAITMNKADATADTTGSVVAATTVSGLAPKYLSQIPQGWDGTAAIGAGGDATSFVSHASVRDDVCASINSKAGLPASGVTTQANVTTQYGCFGGGSGGGNTGTLVYKY